MSTIIIHHGKNIFYFDYYDFETIGDVKSLIYKKYDVSDDDDEIDIFQGSNKLDSKQKIKDLETKENLYIKGIIKSKNRKENNKEIDPPPKIDELAMLHTIGFNDSDELINQLHQKEGYKIEDIIVVLLKKKKKKFN